MKRIILSCTVAALLLPHTLLADDGWTAWDYGFEIRGVEFAVKFKEKQDGTDARFACFNNTNVTIYDCTITGPNDSSNKVYTCRNGTQETRSAEHIGIVDPGKGSQTVPDYNVCRGNGGVRGVQYGGRFSQR